MTKREAGEAVQAAMRERRISYAKLAGELGRPVVWVAAAVLGQHPLTGAEAAAVVELLGLESAAATARTEIPSRGGLDGPVPVDPTVYRLYEIIQVYGPALKALIHEEFGDGIMSAINFKVDLERVADPVRITLDGKFLPYQWG